MFKKTKIAAATVALLSVAAVQNAAAVAIDESGNSAQVLIFPYYNTNNGYATGFNIRNTKNEVKAVKVRFRESNLSNDVLDFNVYMSPYDHFSMALGTNAAGHASLVTQDKTCTYPAIPAAGVEFKGDVYKKTTFDDAREGYLEVIEMGVVTDPKVIAGVTHSKVSSVVNGVTLQVGVPVDCKVLATAWSDGTFTEGGANAVVDGAPHVAVVPAGIKTPSGGLQGWSFLVDTNLGNANVAMPVEIRNYQTTHGQHYLSSHVSTFLLPSLASGNVLDSTVMNNNGDASITTPWTTTTDYVTTVAGKAEVELANGGVAPNASGINPYPIAHVLAATAVTNDYLVTTTGDQAGTDWVISFPMRKHGIYASTTTDVNIAANSGFYDREEQGVAMADEGFSPVSSSPALLLPREVNILSFGMTGATSTSRVLQSKYTKNYGVDHNTGWGSLVFSLNNENTDLPAKAITTGFAAKSKGIPTIGFAAIHGNYKPGAENTIGESIPHNFVRDRSLPPA